MANPPNYLQTRNVRTPASANGGDAHSALDEEEARVALKGAVCDTGEAELALRDASLAKKPASGIPSNPFQALLGLLEYAKQTVGGLSRIAAGLYDLAILIRPDTFTVVSSPVAVTIDPTAGVPGTKAATNDGNVPMMVRIQGPVNAAATATFLYADQRGADTTADKAAVIAYAVGPVISVVLPPSRALYVSGNNPDGSTDPFQVKVTTVALRGRAAIFTRG